MDPNLARSVPVGTLIASMLVPAEFAAEAGGDWVPADGRDTLPNWRYTKITRRSTVPDLRGVFMRGLNVFDDRRPPRAIQHLDPSPNANDRQPGTFSGDSVGPHDHVLLLAATDVINNQMTSVSRRLPSNIVDQFAQAPPLATALSTGMETAPKNVAVYWYIRVD